jgi:opacity protein-like surface antigen
VEGVSLKPEQAAWGDVASQTGGLLVGTDFGDHLGVELALDNLNYQISVAGHGMVAEYGQHWALANLRLRFPKERWTPYAYAGGGICYAEIKDFHPASAGLSLKGDHYHPAVNVGIGVEYFIMRNLSFNADARWAYTWNHTFALENELPSRKGDFSCFVATLGLRVYLAEF